MKKDPIPDFEALPCPPRPCRALCWHASGETNYGEKREGGKPAQQQKNAAALRGREKEGATSDFLGFFFILFTISLSFFRPFSLSLQKKTETKTIHWQSSFFELS